MDRKARRDGVTDQTERPICTKPPGKARPSYCGKMPDGADCAGCPWGGDSNAET